MMLHFASWIEARKRELAREEYVREMREEAIRMRAKKIGHAKGDPNWWNFTDAARAEIERAEKSA